MPVNLVEDKSIGFERIKPLVQTRKLITSMSFLEAAQIFVKFFSYCTMFLMVVSYTILFNIIGEIAPLY